jgi:hypothetical protein
MHVLCVSWPRCTACLQDRAWLGRLQLTTHARRALPIYCTRVQSPRWPLIHIGKSDSWHTGSLITAHMPALTNAMNSHCTLVRTPASARVAQRTGFAPLSTLVLCIELPSCAGTGGGSGEARVLICRVQKGTGSTKLKYKPGLYVTIHTAPAVALIAAAATVTLTDRALAHAQHDKLAPGRHIHDAAAHRPRKHERHPPSNAQSELDADTHVHHEERHDGGAKVGVRAPRRGVVRKEERQHALHREQQQAAEAGPHVARLEEVLALHDERHLAAGGADGEEGRHACTAGCNVAPNVRAARGLHRGCACARTEHWRVLRSPQHGRQRQRNCGGCGGCGGGAPSASLGCRAFAFATAAVDLSSESRISQPSLVA